MSSWLGIIAPITILLVNSIMGSSPTQTLEMRHGRRAIESVRFTRDGKRLVSASIDGTVVMWDSHSGKKIWKVDLDEGSRTKASHTVSEILGMDLAPDASTIAVSYTRGRVVGDRLQGKDQYLIGLLDSTTGREIRVLTGHTDPPGRIVFSPNSELLLSESGDRTARLWNVSTGKQLLRIELNERGAAVAFSPAGTLFAVATQPLFGLPPKPIVGLYDAKTGKLLRAFARRTSVVTSLAFSSDDQTLAIAGGNASGAQIDLWGLRSQEPKTIFSATHREINIIAFSKDGNLLASGGYGNGQGLVEIHDLIANGMTRTFKLKSGVTGLDFSSDGRWLVAGTDKGEIVVLALQAR